MRFSVFAWFDNSIDHSLLPDEFGFTPPLLQRMDVNGRRLLRLKPGDGPSGGGGGGGTYGGGGAGSSAAVTTAGAAGSTAAAASGKSAGNSLPWVFPSSDFLSFQKYGSVALPAIGATAPILTFKVPNGRYGKIASLGIDFVPNGAAGTGLYTQGIVPAQLTFNLSADTVPFQDFGNFPYMPGSASDPLGMAGLMIREAQVITLTVTNVSVVVAAQFIEALVQGYYYSKNLQPKGMSYQ